MNNALEYPALDSNIAHLDTEHLQLMHIHFIDK